jgi:hypothetical protein
MGLRRGEAQSCGHCGHLQIDYELHDANYYYCMYLYDG